MGASHPAPRVVLDAMGVLYQPADDVADLLIPFAGQRGCTTPDDEISALYLDASKGLIRAAELWRRIGVPGAAEALNHEFVAAYSLTEGVGDFLHWCAVSGIRVACISNDLSEWAVARAGHFGLLDFIDPWTISGDVGERKPQGAIYDALQVRPGRIEPAGGRGQLPHRAGAEGAEPTLASPDPAPLEDRGCGIEEAVRILLLGAPTEQQPERVEDLDGVRVRAPTARGGVARKRAAERPVVLAVRVEERFEAPRTQPPALPLMPERSSPETSGAAQSTKSRTCGSIRYASRFIAVETPARQASGSVWISEITLMRPATSRSTWPTAAGRSCWTRRRTDRPRTRAPTARGRHAISRPDRW